MAAAAAPHLSRCDCHDQNTLLCLPYTGRRYTTLDPIICVSWPASIRTDNVLFLMFCVLLPHHTNTPCPPPCPSPPPHPSPFRGTFFCLSRHKREASAGCINKLFSGGRGCEGALLCDSCPVAAPFLYQCLSLACPTTKPPSQYKKRVRARLCLCAPVCACLCVCVLFQACAPKPHVWRRGHVCSSIVSTTTTPPTLCVCRVV